MAADASHPPALDVSDLTFRYPGRKQAVLHGVSLTADAGQVHGVLGANGSGKTTLLSAILGVRAGTSTGRVLVRGYPDFGPAEVGYAPQQAALYRQLTVRENLRHVARLTLPRRAVQAAVDDAIDEYGLSAMAGTRAHQLSGGWQRLAHLAVSFVHRPPVRLLDEPTVALDLERRNELMTRIKTWRSAGCAVLLTSHYPEDIEDLCSHVLLLEEGHVLGQVTLAGLLAGRPLWHLSGGEGSRLREVSAPAPATIGQIPEQIATMVAAGEFAAGEPAHGIRSSARTVRSVLSGNEELRSVLRDG